MMQSALLALMLAAAPAPPVTIYVGPMLRDGFVDVDKGTRDSIKDIRTQFRWKKKEVQVVDDEASADVRLYVLGRNTHTDAGSFASGTVVGGVTMVTSTPTGGVRRLETVLRAGGYERLFTAEGKWTWGGVADHIAKDVAVWVVANRQQLAAAK